MNKRKTIFDPIKRAKKRAPSANEIERIEIETFRGLASIGAANAIPMLVNMLGSFLWSENLPASGPDFDDFADELARTLSMQIECLDGDLATATAQTKGNHHAWN